jgi:hypothetical protein
MRELPGERDGRATTGIRRRPICRHNPETHASGSPSFLLGCGCVEAKVAKKSGPHEFISWVNKFVWLEGDHQEMAVEW